MVEHMREVFGKEHLAYLEVGSREPLRPPLERNDSKDPIWKTNLQQLLSTELRPFGYDKKEKNMLIDLLLGMMAPDPRNRSSYADVLSHEYFSEQVPIQIVPNPFQNVEDYTIASNDIKTSFYIRISAWLLEICIKLKSRWVTYIQGMALFRKVLSSYPGLSRTEMQLVGCICMNFAAHLYEVAPPDIDWYLYFAADLFTRDKFNTKSREILVNILKGNLQVSSVYTILKRKCTTMKNLKSILGIVAICDAIGSYYVFKDGERVLEIAEEIE